MATYVKLGSKAEVFYDAFVDLKVVKNQVVELSKKQANSPKTRKAISGGHLVISTEAEFKGEKPAAPAKEKTAAEKLREKLQEKFDDMTKAELTTYYKDTYEVTEEQVEDFETKKKPEMVEALILLEEEE